MTTTRMRKTFQYPSDDVNDSSHDVPENMDEEGTLCVVVITEWITKA